jgi:acyl dehydratase
LRCRTDATDLKPSKSRPPAGIVTLTHRLLNQRDQIACQCLRSALLKRSDASAFGH